MRGFLRLYITYVDRKARRNAPIRTFMTVTILKISHNLKKTRYSACALVCDYNDTYRVPLPPQPPPAWPWATAWPGPARPQPPRSRLPLLTAEISRPRDRPLHACITGTREAASRRLR